MEDGHEPVDSIDIFVKKVISYCLWRQSEPEELIQWELFLLPAPRMSAFDATTRQGGGGTFKYGLWAEVVDNLGRYQ